MIEHSGGCHCGRVRFEIMAPEDILVSQCNCSICSKSGYLGLLVARSRFKFLQGEDCLTTYTFNTGVAQHLFLSLLRRQVILCSSFASPRIQRQREMPGSRNH